VATYGMQEESTNLEQLYFQLTNGQYAAAPQAQAQPSGWGPPPGGGYGPPSGGGWGPPPGQGGGYPGGGYGGNQW
jgi:ABC-2 type transport system ATP-binding protein